jgi:Uma2 family endonuclease
MGAVKSLPRDQSVSWPPRRPLTRDDLDTMPDDGHRYEVIDGQDTVMQPDLLVARRADFARRDLPKAPLLAVEVLSPSTRRIDLMLKWSRFEAAGCPSYWVVDPDTPSLIAWEMQDGAYVQVAKVTGTESARLTSPYDVTVVPADLTL